MVYLVTCKQSGVKRVPMWALCVGWLGNGVGARATVESLFIRSQDGSNLCRPDGRKLIGGH